MFFPNSVSIEMLSRHRNVFTKMIVPIGLEKTINGSKIKVFREKLIFHMAWTLSS